MVVRAPRPPANAASRAVLGRLNVRGNLTPSILPYVQFSPTVGIAAGRIDKMGMDIRSFKEPLTRAIRDVMVPSIRENFKSGGRPAWEPLAEGTLDIRERLGIGSKGILRKTDQLSRIASQINIWTITENSAVVRDLPASVWYGKIHQAGYGGNSMRAAMKRSGGDGKAALNSVLDRQRDILRGAKTKSGKVKSVKSTMSASAPEIPARPFLMFQPEDEDEVAEIFIKWLQERIDRNWPGR